MTDIENKSIKQQIDFEKYKNGEADKVLKLLENINKEISRYIKQTSGISTKKRYTEIARKIRDIAKELKENIDQSTDIDGVIDYALQKEKSILSSLKKELVKVKGGTFNFLYPTRDQIKTTALFKPIEKSLTYESYLESIENGLYNTWDSALRTGYLTGMTTKNIVANVLGKSGVIGQITSAGTMQTLYNSIYSNTRTVLQSFANETRNRVYEENEQFFGSEDEYKYEFLSTLDSRTCLVCGELSGKLFKTVKDFPQIPLHRGCRCVIIPHYDIEGDKKSSKNGYVADDITFEKWISEQDEKTQKEVLGTTRYNLFQNGTKIKGFVENGAVLNLSELYERLDKNT